MDLPGDFDSLAMMLILGALAIAVFIIGLIVSAVRDLTWSLMQKLGFKKTVVVEESKNADSN